MPHVSGHKEQTGLMSNPYQQAAESMKSVGIKSLSGATTSSPKGQQAQQKQRESGFKPIRDYNTGPVGGSGNGRWNAGWDDDKESNAWDTLRDESKNKNRILNEVVSKYNESWLGAHNEWGNFEDDLPITQAAKFGTNFLLRATALPFELTTAKFVGDPAANIYEGLQEAGYVDPTGTKKTISDKGIFGKLPIGGMEYEQPSPVEFGRGVKTTAEIGTAIASVPSLVRLGLTGVNNLKTLFNTNPKYTYHQQFSQIPEGQFAIADDLNKFEKTANKELVKIINSNTDEGNIIKNIIINSDDLVKNKIFYHGTNKNFMTFDTSSKIFSPHAGFNGVTDSIDTARHYSQIKMADLHGISKLDDNAWELSLLEERFEQPKILAGILNIEKGKLWKLSNQKDIELVAWLEANNPKSVFKYPNISKTEQFKRNVEFLKTDKDPWEMIENNINTLQKKYKYEAFQTKESWGDLPGEKINIMLTNPEKQLVPIYNPNKEILSEKGWAHGFKVKATTKGESNPPKETFIQPRNWENVNEIEIAM